MPLSVDKLLAKEVSVNGVELGTIPIVIGGMNQPTLANTPYTELPIGSILVSKTYGGFEEGCTLFKTTTNNGDFNDWIVIATTNKGITGRIGFNPLLVFEI